MCADADSCRYDALYDIDSDCLCGDVEFDAITLQLCYHLPCDPNERPPAALAWNHPILIAASASDSSDATTYAFQFVKRARNGYGGEVVWSSPPSSSSRFASFTPADLGLDGLTPYRLSVSTQYPTAPVALDNILVAAPPVLLGIEVQALPPGPALSSPSRAALGVGGTSTL